MSTTEDILGQGTAVNLTTAKPVRVGSLVRVPDIKKAGYIFPWNDMLFRVVSLTETTDFWAVPFYPKKDNDYRLYFKMEEVQEMIY